MPLHRDWLSVAKEDPDSRARISRNEKKDKVIGWMEEVFCANCGKPHGMVAKEWAAYVFVLCDECVGKYGHPPGMVELPESVVQGKGQ